MRTELSPFGLLVTAEPGQDVTSLPPALLARWVGQHRLVLLRGFPAVSAEDLADCARAWGPLLRLEHGEVLDVTAIPAMPFHWDGPYADETPSYLFFHCPEAPVAGWEMVFCDTTRLLAALSDAQLRRWEGVSVTYRGVSGFTNPLVDTHPITGRRVLRYREPSSHPAPLLPEFTGLPDAGTLTAELADRLYDPRHCVTHRWQAGDFLLVDNHAVLHRRAPFRPGSPPPLHRVHIL